MMYVVYARPIGDHSFGDWFPHPLRIEQSVIIKDELISVWQKPNDNIGLFRAYISDEDTAFLMVKYESSILPNFCKMK
jgi:hypothetical protein